MIVLTLETLVGMIMRLSDRLSNPILFLKLWASFLINKKRSFLFVKRKGALVHNLIYQKQIVQILIYKILF